MNEGTEWFAPKRFGYGAGLPVARQGWAVLIAYLTIVIGSWLLFSRRPLALVGIVVPATALLIVITARTTRGGWRWRWGKED
jgi:hypothetical protein